MSRSLFVSTVLVLILVAAAGAGAQVSFRLGLNIRDAADSNRTLIWGVHPLATYGIDTLLFGTDTVVEIEQPPLPPLGAFDARWTNPAGHNELGLGTRIDIRHFAATAQVDTYRVRFQPSQGGYPIVLSWPKSLVADYYGCPVRLRMSAAGGPTEIDMRFQDSLVVTDNTVTVVTLIAECPHGPNLIAGTLYEDADGDGVRDAGEPPLAGWSVYLGGDVSGTALTGGDGAYAFTGLPSGSYTVTTELPAGWVRTAPAAVPYEVSVGGGVQAPGRDFGMFRPGVLSGFKFRDANADGFYTPGEEKLAGWKIFLRGAATESTLTGGDGSYSFSGLAAGHYTVREKQDSNYVQLCPSYPGYYAVTVTSGMDDTSLLFGNKEANVFVGQSGGSWSDSSNWSSGHPPTSGDAVVITVPIVIDSLPGDTVIAIRIAPGASVTYAGDDTLIVLQSFQIDSGSTLSFVGPANRPAAAARVAQPVIVCEGSWINNGEFDAGNSLITFAGDAPKVVGSSEFYDLKIEGANTSSGGDSFATKSSGGGTGNIYVTGSFIGGETFDLLPGDTLFILNSSPSALQGSGIITQGTIVRAIAQGATDPYRFESPASYLQFDGTGTYPATVAVTTFPDREQPYPYLQWERVSAVADPGANAVTSLGVQAFSWWTFGQTGAGAYGLPSADRQYVIHASGGAGYAADLGLRYAESELALGTDESALQLLRGPYYADSVAGRWNMVSVPVEPVSAQKESLFAAASSPAFGYDNGSYAIVPLLAPGQGYWIRFPAPAAVRIEGTGLADLSDSLRPGWNLIGVPSVPVAAGALVTEPAGLLAAVIYGYDGSYYPASTLNPMEAYWVKSSAAGRLAFTGAGAAAKRLVSDLAALDALGTLTISDSRGNTQRLWFGAVPAEAGRRYELPPPPPEGSFSVRFASQQLVAAPDAERGDPIIISGAAYPVTLAWSAKPGIEAGLLVGTRRLPLAGSGSVSVASADEAVAVLSTPVAAAPLPARFRLLQNYPNPFNPATVIRYELPADAYVRIVIYNALGQAVGEIAEARMAAGRHELRWNGSGLPSGVYFCRLTAVEAGGSRGIFTAVEKMLLAR